jgi:type IV pilus assembly protein PilB
MREKPKIGELLVRAGAIDEIQLRSALAEQRQWGRPLGMTLVRMGFLDEDTLVHTLANQLKLPVVKLSGKRVNREVLDLVPLDLAEKHRCLPLLLNDEGGKRVLYLGMEDPADLESVDEISFRIGEKVKPVLVAPTELDEALQRHYHWAAFAGGLTVAEDDGGYGEPEFIPTPAASKPETSNPEASEPERASAVAGDADAGQHDAAVTPAAILRALSQLLVEKGIITRDELVDRVGQVLRNGEHSEPS